MSLRVGIVGCGLIGRKRANAIQASQTEKLVVVADVNAERASNMAGEFGCAATAEWQQAIAEYDLDVLIVSTINKYLAPISQAALDAGKHVLCEKPPGRNAAETQCMVDAAKRSGCVLKVGFNHRHHPAIWRAHEFCAQGEIGSPMFIRAVYGHGGRPGYDKEWRADAELSGGGELLDQGVHIIDLCRWFMGDFADVFAATATYCWNLGYFQDVAGQKRQLEDNAFALLRTAEGRIAQFQTSWTQWKNRFSFEVVGTNGYVRIEGLGGSYGDETLVIGHRRPESGPPVEEQIVFSGPDLSWQSEWLEFTSAIRDHRQSLANGEDGLRVMQIIAALYESSLSHQSVRL
jgi:predicted dehydrogenase